METQAIVKILETLLIGLFAWLIKSQLNRVEDNISTMISKADCVECHKGAVKAADEQWEVINHHGHKGLTRDGNLVVRT